MKTSRILCSLSCSLLLAQAACRSGPGIKQPPQPLPVIAVLPFDNQSTDIEASTKVRSAVYNELEKRGYRLAGLDKIDGELKQLGISDGGQLRAVTMEKLHAGIQADLFCYGDVLDFSFKSVVALTQRKVALKLRLASSITGETVFEGSEEGTTSSAGTDAAGNLALNMAGKIFKSVKDGTKRLLSSKPPQQNADITDKIADVDLAQETHEAVLKLIDKFQGRKNR